MSARMGIMQEVLYAKYGKHPREALFFTVSNLLDNMNHIQTINQNYCFIAHSALNIARVAITRIFTLIQRYS